MRSIIVIIRLAFVAHAGDSLENLARKLASRLFDRALEASLCADIDNSTLGKPRYSAVHGGASSRSHHFLTSSFALHEPGQFQRVQPAKVQQHPLLTTKRMRDWQCRPVVKLQHPTPQVRAMEFKFIDEEPQVATKDAEAASDGTASDAEASQGEGEGNEDEDFEGLGQGVACKGRITFWNETKGFGFIQSVGGDESIWFHESSLSGWDDDNPVQLHAHVTYMKFWNAKNDKYLAKMVNPISVISPIAETPMDEADSNRQNGTIISWNNERGFGFIQPYDMDEKALFFHFSQFMDGGPDSLQLRTKVSFLKEWNALKENFQAGDVHLLPNDGTEPESPEESSRVDGFAPRQDEKRYVGQVNMWNIAKGYGFINPQVGGESLFCHASSLQDGLEYLYKQDYVSYTVGLNPRNGKPQAFKVKIWEDELPELPEDQSAEEGEDFDEDSEGTGYMDDEGAAWQDSRAAERRYEEAKRVKVAYEQRKQAKVEIREEELENFKAQQAKKLDKWGGLFFWIQ